MRFKKAWLKGNPEYGFDMKTSVIKIDEILHQERITTGKTKVMYEANLKTLPNGAFVIYNEKPHLLKDGKFYPWGPGGYHSPVSIPLTDTLPVLTPKSIVNMFSAGYVPQMGV